ncbi:MAG TPA: carboxypeptidase-like regulatory domain-containing protein [Blastocatellia bacterium]|nr:carboxypeptidase-like regulatory domain-containing protein [Blastocatellia bacterium]
MNTIRVSCVVGIAALIVGGVAGGVRGKNQSKSSARRGETMTGRVVSSDGRPVFGAIVSARKVGARAFEVRRTGADDKGQFRLDGLRPGAYDVQAEAPGYAFDDSTADRRYYRAGDSVMLTMLKGGVITGSVTNEFGSPVIAVSVTAIRVRDEEGRPVRGSAMADTDDRGLYRIYGLLPGSYVVAANHGRFRPSPAYKNMAPTYHPSATRDTAAVVRVSAGLEVGGIDIRFLGEHGHTISGRLTGDVSPLIHHVTLTHVASGSVAAATYSGTREGGAFSFSGVPDGEYTVTAERRGVGNDVGARSGARRVTVKGADVTGLELSLGPLGSLAGKVVLEEAGDEPVQKNKCQGDSPSAPGETVIVARRDTTDDKAEGPFMLGSPLDTAPSDDGEFFVGNLEPGLYHLDVRLRNEGWYTRAITRSLSSKSSIDIGTSGILIRSGERAAGVTVTIARGAAVLTGRVLATRQSALETLRVHLVPSEPEHRDSALRFFEARVQDDGSFSLSNIAPGRYWLVARVASRDPSSEAYLPPEAWDASKRARLWGDGKARGIGVELQPCQQVSDYKLRHVGSRRSAPR